VNVALSAFKFGLQQTPERRTLTVFQLTEPVFWSTPDPSLGFARKAGNAAAWAGYRPAQPAGEFGAQPKNAWSFS
jgi:hypothetical protein